MSGEDQGELLREAVRRSFEARRSLRIVGSGSKAFLTRGAEAPGAHPGGAWLSVAEHQGVTDYRPDELVVTARSGTPLRELERVLAQAQQRLPFEPPRFRGGGTLGGAVACGLSGPGRPWWGGVRDAVLGVELLNGRGERLRFGGQVMKNVAGYDVSRLQAGAFGTLGVLLSVSLRVLPQPPAEATRVLELPPREALARCRSLARQAHPLTGTWYQGGLLRVRFSGAEAAVRLAAAELGGEPEPDSGFWPALRDHRLEAFSTGGWWRCSMPPAAPAPLDDCLVGWAGAERWWRPAEGVDPVALLARQGGHGRPFDGSFGRRNGAHLSAAERKYAARLEAAFDPAGVLNPELSIGAEATGAD